VIVGVPTAESEYATEQIPELRAHVDEGENDPDELLVVNETDPVGDEPPDTVAVQVEEGEPRVLIEAGAQSRDVVVDSPTTVRGAVPELGAFAESPWYDPVIVTGESILDKGV
jgi:hypothetical protein